jgi:hypothetical protein
MNGIKFHTKEFVKNYTTKNNEIIVKGRYNTSDDEYDGKLKNIF